MQKVLEAEMDEALGASNGERTPERSLMRTVDTWVERARIRGATTLPDKSHRYGPISMPSRRLRHLMALQYERFQAWLTLIKSKNLAFKPQKGRD